MQGYILSSKGSVFFAYIYLKTDPYNIYEEGILDKVNNKDRIVIEVQVSISGNTSQNWVRHILLC